ncbi:MAG TPA: hypothetical protein VHA15_01200 [Burkholderiales bacterium]|jgi:hypothetical protein|nr:hypothetical protein [Burkholderiales bacterium]
MMTSKGIAAAIILGFTVAALSACEREGPMEKAGKKIDKAGEKVGEAVEKAGEKLQDAARDAKK